ncbi:MAG: GIY-YIG nuclease family protein [Deltaproteobacteria bacterium]|nr:GIY-YIG nuclease family protein [Deltaproteobacteria bacterium]
MTQEESKSWWVYIIECADQTLYTGITNHLERRLDAHQEGTAAKYTRNRRPVTLRYHEQQADRSTASQREASIKKMSRQEKLTLIQRGPDTPQVP